MELLGKGATAAVGAATGNPAAVASTAGGSGGGQPSLSAYELALSDPNYFGPDTSSFGSGVSPEDDRLTLASTARERNKWGTGY